MRISRSLRLLAATPIAAVGTAVVLAAPACADDSSILPKDSHGLSPLDYVLSFNEGAGVFGVAVSPQVTIPAGFATLAFGGFIAMALLTFSVFNLFVTFDWINPLVRVAEDLSASISNQLGQSFVWYVVASTMLLTVVVFALRNQGNRAWHHIAITLVCLGVGVVIVLPVGEAASLLKMGRDVAIESGSAATGQANNRAGATATLIDQFVRKPTQQWQFGRDLDSLGCGEAWDRALRSVKAGTLTADKVKDVPLQCPGGAVGEQMHAFAMNPSGAVYLGFLNPVFMFVVMVLVFAVVLMIGGTAVSAIIHAAMIKPGLITAGTSWGQSFLARNIIDGFTAAISTCLLLLLLYVGASLSGLIALAVPSSEVSMVTTIVVIVALVVGTVKAGRKMRRWKNSAAHMVLPAGAPAAYGPPSTAPKHARRLAMETARQSTAGRRNRKLVGAVAAKGATTAAPEMMIPAQALGAFAQHVVHAAHQHQINAASYQSSTGGSGTAWGAPAPTGNTGWVPGGPRSGTPSVGARSVNYNAPASARDMARRSSQQRQTRQRTADMPARQAAAATLRGASAPRPGAGHVRAPAVTGAAQQSALSTTGTSKAAAPGRVTTSSATGSNTGAQQALRRSGAVNTARDAARDSRRRRQ